MRVNNDPPLLFAMSSLRLGLTASLGVALVVLAVSCRRPPTVERVLPRIASGRFSELSESQLAAIVICHDTLGRQKPPTRVIEVSRCTPCLPYGMLSSDTRLRRHAQRLWMQTARAPYDSVDVGVECARLAYRYAKSLRPDDDALIIEASLVDLANADTSVRRVAFVALDSLVGAHIAGGYPDRAAAAISQLAFGIWDRAQRMLERPQKIDVDDLEHAAHDLARSAPPLDHIPNVPTTSSTLGVSEAQWAARLFDAAARLSTTPRDRSRRMRLALAPWVVLGEWASLDSAAAALLLFTPNDSAVLPARALAAYRTMSRPVMESPRVRALFDSTLARMPRVDSAFYDSFDGVLSANDDTWRYGFLPDQRRTLDRRGWAVLDPLWSTSVHEIQLARRARVAEADYRYADIAKAGCSGSETIEGQILLRRGTPTAHWTVTKKYDSRMRIERSWTEMVAVLDQEVDNSWRVFYGTHFTLRKAAQLPPVDPCTAETGTTSSLLSCAVARTAVWPEAPFYGNTSAVDVTVARFRVRGDSVDMYVAARVPLAPFKDRNDETSRDTDRIAAGLWLTNELGVVLHQNTVTRALPAPKDVSWTLQWNTRVGSLRMMHRVEAIELTKPTGARGVARFTTDAQAGFPTRGFGMSDVLVAASAKSTAREAKRWTDLTITPNAATVTAGARFAMLWEVYDLTPGADGRVRWRVRIKRERGELVTRSDMQDVLVGTAKAGSRVLASESDASDMSYVRDEARGGVIVENITTGLGNAPIGNHVINVTIDDLISGKSVTRGVSVRVVLPGA